MIELQFKIVFTPVKLKLNDSQGKRREGDLNSRVQWTVDFESTAIPGYAISAFNSPTCKTIISVVSLPLHDEDWIKGPRV